MPYLQPDQINKKDDIISMSLKSSNVNTFKFKDKERQAQFIFQQKFKDQVNEQDPRYYKIKASFRYLNDYYLKVTQQIGRGGYGVIYKAISVDYPLIKQQYAVKINFNTVARQLIFSEGAFLKICHQKRNLPKLLNFFDYENVTHIVTEYFPHTPFIAMFTELKLQQIKHYLIQLLIGLKSLKQVGIFHRDIKPGNFLYNRQKRTGIIIDFGLAEIDPCHEDILRKQRQNMSQQGISVREIDQKISIYSKLRECLKIVGSRKIGTESFMPPESMLHHSMQNYQSDMWPVGIILLQFTLRKYNVFNHIKRPYKVGDLKNAFFVDYLLQLAIFFGKQAVAQQSRKLQYFIQFPQGLSSINIRQIAKIEGYNTVLQDLLFRLLELDVTQRISVDDAIDHPFFDSVRKEHFQVKKK